MESKTNTEALREIVHYLNQHEFQQASHRNAQFHPLYVTALKVKATYFNYKLSSRFQPIFNLRNGRTEAHEAFINVKPLSGGTLAEALTPNSVFLLPFDQAGITYIDRLARTANTLNFLAQNDSLAHTGGFADKGSQQLHLNVHPLLLTAVKSDHGKVFEGILHQCGIETSQITLEVSEYAIPDKDLLADAIKAWQERGYRIAIDNFGRIHQDSAAIVKFAPDVIKLDRRFLAEAEGDATLLTPLQALLERAGEQDIDVIATGVETAIQLDFVRQLGIGMAQGYLLGKPAGFIDTDENAQDCAATEDDDSVTSASDFGEKGAQIQLRA